MLHDERADVAADSPEALAASYREELAEIVDERGVDAASDETGVETSTLEALVAGDEPELELADAAAIQALAADADAEAIRTEACEHLLLGMSMAVLDVEALATGYEGDLDAKALQQRLERRAPMTLAEFARVEHYVASERS